MRGAGSPTAEALLAAVRVHADRVHDAVRRQGCGPAPAVRVVETSALELVDLVADGRTPVEAAVGQWFARARTLGVRAGRDGGEPPVGTGLLAADDAQARLAGALERRPERERTALLLRDAYDLPAATVGAALGTDADHASELVGRARTALLADVRATAGRSLADHDVDAGALARLAEGGVTAVRDGATRRHAQGCALCRSVVEAQDDARRLLAGLVVVALPEAERARLLERVGGRARAVLPAEVAAVVALEDDEQDEPRRLLSPLPVLLSVVGAVALGIALGVALSGDEPERLASVDLLPPVTAPALPSVAPTPAPPPSATAAPEPTTTVFTLPPTTSPPPPPPPPSPAAPPAPVPTITPTAAPPAAPGAALALDPATGPNGTEVTVTGTGFSPGSLLRLTYRRADGRDTGTEVDVVVDGTGGFVEPLVLQDPLEVPGPHLLAADDGTTTATATFTVPP